LRLEVSGVAQCFVGMVQKRMFCIFILMVVQSSGVRLDGRTQGTPLQVDGLRVFKFACYSVRDFYAAEKNVYLKV